MEFDRVDVEPTTLKEKPVFKVTAHGKFLPTSGKNFSFRIKDPADEVIKNVSITVERKGVAYPNGTVVGWIYSKSREALEKQSFCVEVYRYYQQGKVYGHEIAPVKSPIVSPPTQYSTPPSPL